MSDNIDWDWVVAKAQGMACEAHAGQTRRDEITPYIKHPAKVVDILTDWRWEYRDERLWCQMAIAWLHDVLEDTEFTAEDIRNADIPETVIRSVETLTKNPGEDYDAFIQRIVDSKDEDARQVKLADIVANLSDNPKPKQMIKYGKALVALNQNL